jgi:3-oxoacyl-[acyl-carrier protein] reductase
VDTKKIAIVTGASSGIGRAIAIRLAKDGFHVLAHYHHGQDKVAATLKAIREADGSGDDIQFDVRNSQNLQEKLEGYFTDHPDYRLYVLVNNAGIHDDALCGMMTDPQFDRILQTNVYGPFFLMRWCARKMLRHREGVMVNISSLSGQLGNAGQINYAASKGALIAMTKTLAAELGPKGIRVNAIAPGIIDTDMVKGTPGLDSLKERIPLKRFGKPEEVAGAVSFLCSHDASYITGHTLSVNGGLFPS